MGWLDNFKSIFQPQNIEEIDPNQLPNDVLDDLQNKSFNKIPSEEFHSFGSNNRNIEHDHQQMFSEMDEMMKRLFNFQPNFKLQFSDPAIGDERHDSNDRQSQTLRDKMIDDDNSDKPFEFGRTFMFPFHSTQPRLPQHHSDEDHDLDDRFDSGKQSLDDILNDRRSSPSSDDSMLRQPGSESMFGFSPFSFFSGGGSGGGGFIPEEHNDVTSAFKYSTMTKKINPDGSIETETRKRDSDGNEEVVVSRSVGDQTHTVISKKNNRGEEEKTENLINMEQDDLLKFEERWKSKQPGPRDKIISSNPQILQSEEGWKDLFTSWWKPNL